MSPRTPGRVGLPKLLVGAEYSKSKVARMLESTHSGGSYGISQAPDTLERAARLPHGSGEHESVQDGGIDTGMDVSYQGPQSEAEKRGFLKRGLVVGLGWRETSPDPPREIQTGHCPGSRALLAKRRSWCCCQRTARP